MSEWRDVYYRFNRLRRDWHVHDHPGVNRQLFVHAVLSRRTDAVVERELASFDVVRLPKSLWDEARELNAAMGFPNSAGQHADHPCEDVYQAAGAVGRPRRCPHAAPVARRRVDSAAQHAPAQMTRSHAGVISPG